MEAFFKYIINGDIAAIKRSFDSSSEEEKHGLLSYQDDNGRTPLHIAALYSNEEAVDILIENGANINALDFNGNTPIFHAILSRSQTIIDKLVQNKAILEWVNSNGETPLHYAAGVKALEILNFILVQGVEVNPSSTPSSDPPLFYAVRAAWLDGIKALVDFGAKVDPRGSLKRVIPIIIQMYRNISSSPSKKNNNSQHRSLIREKSISGEQAYEIVDFLVQHGADINAAFTVKDSSKTQETNALQDAIIMSDQKMIEILLRGKPSINKPLPNGVLPLELAIQRNCPQIIIQMLIEAKADAQHVNDLGQTDLHLACMNSDINVETVQYLIDYYSKYTANYLAIADREINECQDPKQIAEKRIGKRVADIYKNSPRKVDPFFVDKEGNSPLFYAAQSSSKEAVKLFIEYGCDPKVENKRRYTSYSIAKPDMSNYMYEIANTDEKQEIFDKLAFINPYHNKVEASGSPEKKNKTVTVYSKESVTRLESKKSQKSPKASQSQANEPTPKKSQVQTARPWRGVVEAEEFRRETRINLRKLRLEMREKIDALKKSIQDIADENEIEL
ncbi:hypothetical protein TVAG_119460 [Trichomonas vaginalis G3]|uniref:Uncharacterized protein n=1 Tax=Trichomonas vaginalis (strain ATCC PRA-98 / G3) TaxID=412133 RepID=A2D792_TRIV3|nr:spectrin binding [Trichomonas vaginalis G3]EAY23609.1 hypothetical protein TVAG_119460 [Trichomonas vaginalis G3]KAI5490102.1 spectrin binding [Trichomonas vaginalis G3]|eukprot:XP_001276857.1 hypothetical protein [Trichomonas vaginalis G3]